MSDDFSGEWFEPGSIEDKDQLKIYKEWESPTLRIEEEPVTMKPQIVQDIVTVKVDSSSGSGSGSDPLSKKCSSNGSSQGYTRNIGLADMSSVNRLIQGNDVIPNKISLGLTKQKSRTSSIEKGMGSPARHLRDPAKEGLADFLGFKPANNL